jgi:hypothetical protein
VQGIGLEPGDIITGSTTDAATVDYVVWTCDTDLPFQVRCFDKNGALKTYGVGITGTAPLVAGASTTLTAGNNGQTILLNTAAGSVVTLPAATGSGVKFLFVVTTTTTSGAHKILAASTSDFLNGIVTGENANTAKCFASAAATNHSIQMPFSGSQPSGGFIGDWFQFEDVATNLWSVQGMYQAGTTPTTPFSSADS